jgi:hypothetical protein
VAFDSEEKSKPYVNRKAIAEYVKSTFIPHITRIHVEMGIEQEDAVFVMDLLSSVRVRVVIFAPHTTQISQLLDLTLSGIFKREGKYHLPFGDLGTTVNFVYNAYTTMTKTVTPQTYGPHFRRLEWSGVKWYLTREAFHLVLCWLSPRKVEGIEGIR